MSRAWRHARVMSVIPLNADINWRGLRVRLSPHQADITKRLSMSALFAHKD